MKAGAAKNKKAQSAMEYLMTYGWAILIIAVVLGTLFQLGVFNSTNFSPRAQPGSCRVLRTAGSVNLVGVCSGQLPQYVAQFNGQSSYINTPLSMSSGTSMTVDAWFNLNSIPLNNAGIIDAAGSPSAYGSLALFPNSNCYIQVLVTNTVASSYFITPVPSLCLQPKTWYQIAVWVNQQTNTFGFYINGVAMTSSAFTGTFGSATSFNIGRFQSSSYFPGQIADVQIYNTSLDASQIQALYLEGIGGSPISPQYLIGWWPLNGDTNDYSGNNNNGAPTNIVYISSWLSGYQGH